MYKCIHTYVHLYIYTYIRVHTYVHIYTRIYIHIYIYIYVSTYTYIFFVYPHTCTHSGETGEDRKHKRGPQAIASDNDAPEFCSSEGIFSIYSFIKY